MVERMTAAQVKALQDKEQNLPEATVITQVRQYLKTLGWYVIRIQQGIGCHRGLSDLICVKDGRTVFLECKATKGKLSEHQEKFRVEITLRGGEYRVARCLEDVMDMGRVE